MRDERFVFALFGLQHKPFGLRLLRFVPREELLQSNHLLHSALWERHCMLLPLALRPSIGVSLRPFEPPAVRASRGVIHFDLVLQQHRLQASPHDSIGGFSVFVGVVPVFIGGAAFHAVENGAFDLHLVLRETGERCIHFLDRVYSEPCDQQAAAG